MNNNPGFVTSSFCLTGDCVAVCYAAEDVFVTNTGPHNATMLRFTHEEWHAFLAGVKNREFDF